MFQRALFNTRRIPLSLTSRVFLNSNIRYFSSSPKQENEELFINQQTQKLVSNFQNMSSREIYHYTSIFLAGATPLCIALSPSLLNAPIDFTLGLAVPIHSHYGLKGVFEDYIPHPFRGTSILLLYILTSLTIIGLLKINLCGVGITESVKSLWKEVDGSPNPYLIKQQQQQEEQK